MSTKNLRQNNFCLKTNLGAKNIGFEKYLGSDKIVDQKNFGHDPFWVQRNFNNHIRVWYTYLQSCRRVLLPFETIPGRVGLGRVGSVGV